MMKHTAKLLIALSLAWGVNAQAASVTYLLNQSNALVDGPTYLKVTISDSTLHVGDIDFKVETTAVFNTAGASNFGIQAFGFNPTVSITGTNIYGLDSHWSVGSGTLDGFGSFAVTESGTGGTRQDPLIFSINVAGDSISSYANPSTGDAGSWEGSGAAFFAAHVAGFASTQGVTSAYFAGNTVAPSSVVPVPAAAWLLGSGLLGLIGVSRRNAV